MNSTQPQMIDAERWLRLKDHLADLSEIAASERADAIDALALDADDRSHLERLLAPLDHFSASLQAPHPAARAAAIDVHPLRCHPGDIVGRYRIGGLLGIGGMGEVYEARATDGGAEVALKVLRSGLAQSDYGRFSENEQRALRRLDDPRIARFVEAFVAPDVGTCLVIERVDGEQLQTYCRSRRFDVQARLKLFIEVCHAVASAHRQLVVHRDLKPGNVLVTPEGQVKLLDFGVSKLLDEASTQTQTHGHLFTLAYAAPEQVLREPVSTATDIYALGVLLYQLLTDVSPYPLDEGASLVKAVLNDPPQPLSAAVRRAHATGGAPPALHLDRDLDRVVAHAMEKEPRSRYRSALELVADVQAVLDGRPIAGGGGAFYRMRKFVRRHRASVLAGGVAALSLLVATVFSLYAARSAALQAHRAEVANRFLLSTLDFTDRFNGNSGDFTLADVLERAVTQARSQLSDEPEVRADVLLKLSYALHHGGKTEAALAAAQEAYMLRTADAQSTPIERAEAAQHLASNEIERGLLDQASAHLDEALQLLQHERGDDKDTLLIRAYTSLGKLASMRGDAEASMRWYQQIPSLRQSLPGGNEIDLAMDYNNLGTGLYNLGRFDESERAYAQGIGLLRQHLGTAHPRLGFVMYGRTSALIQLGRFDEARALLAETERTLRSSSEGVGSNTPGALSTDRLHAQLELFAGRYQRALHFVANTVTQTRASSPVTVGASLGLRGRIELASGDVPAAIASFAEAEALLVDSGRARHVQRWYVHAMQGVARARSGAVAQGDAELDEALAAIDADGKRLSIEQIELLMLSGAAARRRGDVAAALSLHQRAEAMRVQSGWLGALGAARIEAELAQDALAAKPDASARRRNADRLAQAIKVMRGFAPGDSQLPALEAVHAQASVP